VVTDLLLESFSDLFDVTYTARMEEGAGRDRGRQDRLARDDGRFYQRFERDMDHAERHMTDIKRMEKPTDLVCDKCGQADGDQVGQAWQLHRLHRLPECTNTRELTVDLPDVDTADADRAGRHEYCETAAGPWC